MANLQYRKGDIFESNAQVIVNTVNCQGVMGKGLALTFKQKYPAMFHVYQHATNGSTKVAKRKRQKLHTDVEGSVVQLLPERELVS